MNHPSPHILLIFDTTHRLHRRQFGIYQKMPVDNAELASADYWNHRYEEIRVEEAYDWFRDWEQLGAWFKDHLPRPHAKVLHLGCGNSVSLPCLIWVSTRNNLTSVIICCGEGTEQCHCFLVEIAFVGILRIYTVATFPAHLAYKSEIEAKASNRA